MTKYKLGYSSKFKKQYKKIIKQGKDINKLEPIIFLSRIFRDYNDDF